MKVHCLPLIISADKNGNVIIEAFPSTIQLTKDLVRVASRLPGVMLIGDAGVRFVAWNGQADYVYHLPKRSNAVYLRRRAASMLLEYHPVVENKLTRERVPYVSSATAAGVEKRKVQNAQADVGAAAVPAVCL